MTERFPEIPVGDVGGVETWETASRPTGQDRFDALTPEEQDAEFGPETAQKLRDGDITLADLIRRTSPGNTPGFIVAKSIQTKDYDPNEPRDERGRWTEVPGGSVPPPVQVLEHAGTPAGPGMAKFDPAIHGSPRAAFDGDPTKGLSQIQSTHSWPEGVDAIPIRPTYELSEYSSRGEFVQHGTQPKEIRIGEGLTQEQLDQALTHEMGHFLDMSMSEEGVSFLSEGYPSPAMEEFLEVARESPTMKTVLENGSSADIDYLNSPRELWARAYAQFITGKSTRQSFDGTEFRPIGRAVHAVLKEQGLL